MVNITIGVASLIVHHHLRLSGLYGVVLRTVLSHHRHSDRRLVGKMIGVARARTAGTIGRELMDTRYSSREVASKRREIHCRPSVELMYLRGKKASVPFERNWRAIAGRKVTSGDTLSFSREE